MCKNEKLKVIDLSGYSFSGKSAYFDLVCEFDGYKHYSKEFEFELIRLPNGILDLYYSLVENWSPVRSSEAIRKFKSLVDILSGNDGFISRLVSRGYKYDYYFPGFYAISQEYLDKLIIASWKSEWPFAYNDYPKYQIFFKKLLFRLGKRDIFSARIYLSRFDKKDFLNITREYLDKLFSSCIANNEKAIVLSNAFETTNPTISHQLCYSAKSIVVDRDPRDIYLAALNTGYVNGINVGKTAIGDNVEIFIERFKLYRKDLVSDENVLRINFEDLVLNYEETLNKLFIFLGEDKSIHKYPKKYFDPEVSKKGVGMWKNVDNQLKKDVDKIYSELKEYCVNI